MYFQHSNSRDNKEESMYRLTSPSTPTGYCRAALPFAPGDRKRVAVKIIDDRGIESLRIIDTA